MSVTGASDGEATKVGVPIADILTSNYVVISILAALRMRDQTHEGQFIDLSLLDVQMSSLANVASAYLNTGFSSERLGNRHNNVAPYQVFDCADGPLMICAGTDGQFQKLCMILDRKEWANDARFVTNTLRKQHEAELVKMITELTIKKTRDEWIALLQQYKIPGGRVNTIAEALEQPQILAREMIGELEHELYGKVKFVKNPLQFSSLNIQYNLAPPTLGEHTETFQKSTLSK